MEKESKDKALIDHFLHMLYLQGDKPKYFTSFTDQCCTQIPIYKENVRREKLKERSGSLLAEFCPCKWKNYLNPLLDHGKYDGLWF